MANGYGTQSEWDACVRSMPGGIDLYGDCDYLIPMYPSPPSQNATGTGPPRTPTAFDMTKFLKDNGVYLLGGLVVLVLLTKRT